MTRYPFFLIDKNTYHAKLAGNLSSCFTPGDPWEILDVSLVTVGYVEKRLKWLCPNAMCHASAHGVRTGLSDDY